MTAARPIEGRDRERWRELFRAYGDFYETEFADDVLDRVWGWLLEPDHDVRGFVAEHDGAIVGIAHLRRLLDTFTGGPGWFLDDLYVDAAVRGSGAGSALLEAVADHARRHGGGTLRWITAADNATAQRLYDRVATRTTWVTYERET